VDPAPLLDLAVAVATEAGALLLSRLHDVRAEVGTKTSGTDMVTEVDRAAERLVVDRLLAARPDDGVLGEEGAATAGTSGVRWVVDPIDGTTNYLYRMPGFAVSLAAEVDGTVVAGVVADPSHGEVFTASLGGGAACNGRPISVSPSTVLATALVATGFSYDPVRRRRQAAVLTQVLPAVRDIRRHGAASIDLCWTACGRVDAFYERGLQPWDLAAGALVAAEAGATVGDLDGGAPSGAFVLAAAPALFGPLRSLLASAGAGTA
jgi:myo-inositol-1(or 4)-monophosphatase